MLSGSKGYPFVSVKDVLQIFLEVYNPTEFVPYSTVGTNNGSFQSWLYCHFYFWR